MLKQSDYTLKIGDQNLRLMTTNSDSEQRHINQVINILKRHQQLRIEDSEALLIIQDRINANGFLQTRSSTKGKCVINIKLALWTTSLPCLYKQVCLWKKHVRTHTSICREFQITHIQALANLFYSKLNLCNYHSCDKLFC